MGTRYVVLIMGLVGGYGVSVRAADEGLVPGILTISAEVYARSATLTPEPVRRPLPYTIAKDESGKIFFADENGRLDARGARGRLQVQLDSAYFTVRGRTDAAYSMDVSPSQVASGGRVIFDDRHAPLGARMCRAHLENARRQVLRALPNAEPVPAWFNSPVECRIDFDEGCNAAWDGVRLTFNRGDRNCVPAAEVADMIYHEYGHGVVDHLAPLPAVDSILTEGFADLMFAFEYGDPRFSVGFWRGRQISWLRDISAPKVFPGDYAGTYTGSETFSSAWWAIRDALRRVMGPLAGGELAMRSLIDSIRNLTHSPDQDDLIAAAQAGVESLERMAASEKIAGLPCLVRRIFAKHGLFSMPRNCPTVRMIAVAGVGSVDIRLLNEGSVGIPAAKLLMSAGSVRMERPLSPLAVGLESTQRVPVMAAGLTCGQPIRMKFEAWSSDGQLLATAETDYYPGQTSEAREVQVDLITGWSPESRMIPDATAAVLGDWRRFPFSAELAADERVISGRLESEIQHLLPDDLLFAISGRPLGVLFVPQFEFYKGEEEIPVPGVLPVPVEGITRGSGELMIRDTAKVFQGQVNRAVLRLAVAQFDCSALPAAP